MVEYSDGTCYDCGDEGHFGADCSLAAARFHPCEQPVVLVKFIYMSLLPKSFGSKKSKNFGSWLFLKLMKGLVPLL